MIAVIQRVVFAQVWTGGTRIAGIEHGLLALLAVERHDGASDADRMLERLLTYRVFADDSGKMNLNVQEVDGGLLLVPQFTLAADTRKGSRPSLSPAATPSLGEQQFRYLVARARTKYTRVANGQFGADMQVQLVNDGPVTFILKTRPEG